MPRKFRVTEHDLAIAHLRSALAHLDEVGELSAAPYVQMSLDILENRERPSRRLGEQF